MLVIGSEANVAIMRGAIEPDRIVVSAAGGFALDSGRIISASLEDAGESLSAAGWIDRPIEIVARPRRRELPQVDEAGPVPDGLLSRAQATQMLDALEF